MAFESAIFRPEQGSYEVEAIRAHLDALPHAFLDPVEGKKYHLSGTVAEAQQNRRARLADPRRFPYGVLVELRPDGVLVDQSPIADALARARAFVGWLQQQGRWSVRTEAGELGAASLEQLYPEALPELDSLAEDLFTSPPPHGVLWTWRDGRDEVWLHDSGAWKVVRDGQVRQGKLGDAQLPDLDPDDVDGGAEDPAETASLTRETPEQEGAVYFDRRRPPEELAALLALLGEVRSAAF